MPVGAGGCGASSEEISGRVEPIVLDLNLVAEWIGRVPGDASVERKSARGATGFVRVGLDLDAVKPIGLSVVPEGDVCGIIDVDELA